MTEANNTLDWSKLQEVYELCKYKVGVSFSLHFEEGSDTWYFAIHSPAPAERAVLKSTTFDFAVQSVIEYLNSIK